MRLSDCGAGITSPLLRRPCSANHSMKLAPYAISPRASDSGLPCSMVMMRARSSWASIINSYQRRNNAARSLALRAAQAGKARVAAWIAMRVSASPMLGTVPTRSAVAGFTTSRTL
ncbi:hypothetical protein D9M68_776130 [compost metagenome]